MPNPGQGVRFDGAEVRHVITLGRDTRLAIPQYRWHVISHETGHLMGLPDLYLFSGTDVHAPIGAWDNMGLISIGAHFTAWQKRKLGWLAGEEFACVTARSARVDLSPLSTSSGVRGVAVKIGPSKAIVAEVRRKIGHDARLCEPGLLVYTVDSSIASGRGPLAAQRAAADVAGRVGACGSGYNAAFGAPKETVFRDATTGVSLEIVNDRGDAGMTVAVTNPAGAAAPPRINAAAAAGAFGALRTVAPGGWLEIFGEDLSVSSRAWADADFANGRAPTALDGVSVTIDGQPGFVAFVSPGQINVQAPSSIRAGAQAPVVVSNSAGVSTTMMIATAARAPGLLAPPQFSANGKQYVAALYGDLAFVGPPSLVAGATFRPASAGDVVVLYGVGFGATTPANAAGQPATAGALPNAMLKLGDVTVPLAYAGAAPGAFGLYQFNFTVPAGLSGDLPLTLSVDGVTTTQTLWFSTK
ncbi:MAG: hypothetical protein FJW38_17885 [Acidobacteria bacterium]|nr:hypothetical protein [Acidobacteriota bacterium]